MTPWLSRDGFGDAPTMAIVFDSRRIVSGSRTTSGYARRMGLRAVVFDVDFTIASPWAVSCVLSAVVYGLASPGPARGPGGSRRLGERHGLELDPARYDEARRA